MDKPPVENPAAEESAPVQLAEQMVVLLDESEKEVLIISAYLIPSIELEGAIERAVQRGVDVRILTNSIRSNNHLAAHSAYRKHINDLLADGAKLHKVRVDARHRHFYMFPPTDKKSLALHAKALVIDSDNVLIGSANLDPRSLRLNIAPHLPLSMEATQVVKDCSGKVPVNNMGSGRRLFPQIQCGRNPRNLPVSGPAIFRRCGNFLRPVWLPWDATFSPLMSADNTIAPGTKFVKTKIVLISNIIGTPRL